jgi:hypothetical protein
MKLSARPNLNGKVKVLQLPCPPPNVWKYTIELHYTKPSGIALSAQFVVMSLEPLPTMGKMKLHDAAAVLV